MTTSSTHELDRRPRTAFIVCEAGSDIEPLVTILNSLDVKTLNFKDVAVGTNLTRSIRELIDQADIILAIVDKPINNNVLLELGIAIGSQRPVVVIGRDADIPRNLEGIFWIRASLSDRPALTFQLDAYISNINVKMPKRISKNSRRFTNIRQTSKVISQSVAGSALEQDLLQAFEQSSEVTAIVQEPRIESYKNYIPDFAIWTAESPTSVEGPIIVEVKETPLLGLDHQRAVDRLREYAVSADVQSGLLLINRLGEDKPTVYYLSPFIMSLSVVECKRLLLSGHLVDTLRRERNRFAHSAA